MKHIFLLNNHIATVMSLQVIESTSIDPDDVILLTCRHYTLPEKVLKHNYKIADFSDFFKLDITGFKSIISSLRHPRKHIEQIKKLDQKLAMLLGDNRDFTLYIPHSYDSSCRLLISHPNCKGFYIVEEGTLAYAVTGKNNKHHLSLKQKIFHSAVYLLTKGRSCSIRYCSYTFNVKSRRFKGFFGCSANTFRGLPNRTLLPPPFNTLDDIPEDLRAVVVFDAGLVSNEDLLNSFSRSMKYAVQQRKHQCIYYKFHPAQNTEFRAEFRKDISALSKQSGVTAKELPDNVVLENLAFTLKEQLDIFIICSSVGLYGNACGCNIFTTARHYAAKYPLLQKHYDTYGYIFNQYKQI